jgi:hypothetical protein
LLENIKETRDKSVTKPVCLLNQTHESLRGNVILLRLRHNSSANPNNDNVRPFVDQEHSCIPCTDQTKKSYACQINSKRTVQPYEQYYDKLVDKSFDQIINSSLDYSVKVRLEALQRELEGCNESKSYSTEFKTNEERIGFLRSQHYYINDYTSDRSNKLLYAVHFPVNRLFTLRSEARAIKGLAETVICCFYSKLFVVYTDDNFGEDLN